MHTVLITGGSRGDWRGLRAGVCACGLAGGIYLSGKTVSAPVRWPGRPAHSRFAPTCGKIWRSAGQRRKLWSHFGVVDALVLQCGCGGAKDVSGQSRTRTGSACWTSICSARCARSVPACRICCTPSAAALVTISSMWGTVGCILRKPTMPPARAALIGLTRSLALELGPSGIRVNCVAPGVIDTDMNAVHSAETMQALAAETPLGRIGTADEVADSILYLCSDRASFITGQVLGVTGGF